jgi:prepilin signal peptidase PulO-like enzyme (type II secretory pathway)
MSDVTAPLMFAFGAIIGSFLNVVILRSRAVTSASPRSFVPAAPVKTSRSHCPHCRQALRWYELVPILSFIWQRGRCRRCRHELSPQYPLVEAAMGLSVLVLFTPLPASVLTYVAAILASIIIALLIILFVIDLRTFLLPDIFVALLGTVTILRIVLPLTTYHLPLTTSLWGVLIGAGFLALLWLITAGRGIGLGDVKLMVPLGALFGPAATLVLLLGAFITGGAFALALLAAGKATMKTPVPFGPFLAGMAVLFLLAPQLPAVALSLLLGS